jgi:hypothetical protein
MKRHMFFGALFLLGILFALSSLIPHVGQALWKGFFWVIFVVAVALVLGVAVNILWTMRSMYNGYDSADQNTERSPDVPEKASVILPFAEPGKDPEIVAPAEDLLLELCRAECALANVETSASLQALTQKQKRRYSHALKEIQALVQEVSHTGNAEKAAS